MNTENKYLLPEALLSVVLLKVMHFSAFGNCVCPFLTQHVTLSMLQTCIHFALLRLIPFLYNYCHPPISFLLCVTALVHFSFSLSLIPFLCYCHSPIPPPPSPPLPLGLMRPSWLIGRKTQSYLLSFLLCVIAIVQRLSLSLPPPTHKQNNKQTQHNKQQIQLSVNLMHV